MSPSTTRAIFFFTTRETIRPDCFRAIESVDCGCVATLFTREFLSCRASPPGARRARLVQWLQAYSLYPEDLRMVLATFLSEFHYATLWHGDGPDLLLMAPTVPATDILNRAQALYSNTSLHDDFKQLGLDETVSDCSAFTCWTTQACGIFPRAHKSTRMISLCSNTTRHDPCWFTVSKTKNRAAILLAQKDAFAGRFFRHTCAIRRSRPPLQHP